MNHDITVFQYSNYNLVCPGNKENVIILKNNCFICVVDNIYVALDLIDYYKKNGI